MKKNRLIFFAVFALFHLFLVIFTFYVDSQKNDFAFLTQMLKLISLTKYGAIFGLLLLITDVIWSMISEKDLVKENSALNHELNTLKAKLFDMQEASKKSTPSSPNTKL
jgi:hypothetical protein